MESKRNPRLLVRPKKASWWLTDKKFLAYMLRELTAFFIAIYVVLLSFWLALLASGEQFFFEFSQLIWSPTFIPISLVLLAFSVYHSITWFNLTSKAQPLRLGGVAIPRGMVSIGSIIAWVGLSILLVLSARELNIWQLFPS